MGTLINQQSSEFVKVDENIRLNIPISEEGLLRERFTLVKVCEYAPLKYQIILQRNNQETNNT